MKKQKPIVGITMGDPAGIGAEIIVKALCRKEIYNKAKPIVIGSQSIIKDALRFIPSKLELEINYIQDIKDAKGEFGIIDLVDLNNININDFEYGKLSAKTGQASLDYIHKSIDLVTNSAIDAVVTGPINKIAIQLAGSTFADHSTIFAHRTKTKTHALMLIEKNLRVIHVSTHVSLRTACDLVKKDRIVNVIHLAEKALKDLGIKRPKIGIAGLNPHCGENGLFGDEEIKEIIPAIDQTKNEGLNVDGPIPPDTIFPKVIGGQYDIAVVMYHDQGHIPIKITGFKYNKSSDKWLKMGGVVVTVGLPVIRVTVDHGVAFGKAGEGRANEGSMLEAIRIATKFAQK